MTHTADQSLIKTVIILAITHDFGIYRISKQGSFVFRMLGHERKCMSLTFYSIITPNVIFVFENIMEN